MRKVILRYPEMRKPAEIQTSPARLALLSFSSTLNTLKGQKNGVYPSQEKNLQGKPACEFFKNTDAVYVSFRTTNKADPNSYIAFKIHQPDAEKDEDARIHEMTTTNTPNVFSTKEKAAGQLDTHPYLIMKKPSGGFDVTPIPQEIPNNVCSELLQLGKLTQPNIEILNKLKSLHDLKSTDAKNPNIVAQIMQNTRLTQAVLAIYSAKDSLLANPQYSPLLLISAIRICTPNELSVLFKFLNDNTLNNNDTFKTHFKMNGTGTHTKILGVYSNTLLAGFTAAVQYCQTSLDKLKTKQSTLETIDPTSPKAAAIARINDVFNKTRNGEASLHDCWDIIQAEKKTVAAHSKGSDSAAATLYRLSHFGHESESAKLLADLEKDVVTAMKMQIRDFPLPPSVSTFRRQSSIGV